MIFKTGDKIKAKKPHACGGKEWKILRTGADVKLKCTVCGRIIFVSVPEAEKITATYIPQGGKSESQNAVR